MYSIKGGRAWQRSRLGWLLQVIAALLLVVSPGSTSSSETTLAKLQQKVRMLLAVLLLAPAPCLSQRWMLLGGYTGFEGESDAGATAQVLLNAGA